MKEIPLTQGKVALVDDEDFDWLSEWKWSASGSDRDVTAVRRVSRTKCVKMSREIVEHHGNVIPQGMVVDHINRNTLDNRKQNLRVVTSFVNHLNRHIPNSCRYKGVRRNANKFVARIGIAGKIRHLGSFSTEEEAARAYDAAAWEAYGPNAQLNFPV